MAVIPEEDSPPRQAADAAHRLHGGAGVSALEVPLRNDAAMPRESSADAASVQAPAGAETSGMLADAHIIALDTVRVSASDDVVTVDVKAVWCGDVAAGLASPTSDNVLTWRGELLTWRGEPLTWR